VIIRRDVPFYRRPIALLGVGVALIALAVGAGVFFLTGNNDDDGGVNDPVREKTPTQSRSGTAGGADTVLPIKANEATLNLEELPVNYEVDEGNTFAMNITTFSSSYWFRSDREGQERSVDWKIIDGFQVWYQPKGQLAETLQGPPYVRIETYKFVDQDGAKQAWNHLDALMKRTTGSQPVEARPLANDWSAFRLYESTIPKSDVLAVYHRFSFRRGNFVVTVQTWGADGFMNIDSARNIAAAIDDKLLGTRPAVEPTPIPTPSFPGLGN
jgi:hypothetical protein